MLKPAQLYREEIDRKFKSIWYDPDYMYYTMSPGNDAYSIPEDNWDKHVFASVDKDDNVIGAISYNINWQIGSVTNLGAIAFTQMHPTFMKDMRQAIYDIFFKYNANRLGFYSVADNPHVESYKRFINRYGGSICGYEHECCKLMDGKVHDIIFFELMAKDFKAHYRTKPIDPTANTLENARSFIDNRDKRIRLPMINNGSQIGHFLDISVRGTQVLLSKENQND